MKGNQFKTIVFIKIFFFLIFALHIFSGCWSAIPTTFNEIKQYISEREKTYNVSRDQLLGASLHSLKQMGFNLDKIINLPEKASVSASWEKIDISITLFSNTLFLSTLKSRITTQQIEREHSIEKSLFEDVSKIIDKGNLTHFRQATADMVKVYADHSHQSDIIAFLKTGMNISVFEQKDGWAKIDLENGFIGYVYSTSLMK